MKIGGDLAAWIQVSFCLAEDVVLRSLLVTIAVEQWQKSTRGLAVAYGFTWRKPKVYFPIAIAFLLPLVYFFIRSTSSSDDNWPSLELLYSIFLLTGRLVPGLHGRSVVSSTGRLDVLTLRCGGNDIVRCCKLLVEPWFGAARLVWGAFKRVADFIDSFGFGEKYAFVNADSQDSLQVSWSY